MPESATEFLPINNGGSKAVSRPGCRIIKDPLPLCPLPVILREDLRSSKIKELRVFTQNASYELRLDKVWKGN